MVEREKEKEKDKKDRVVSIKQLSKLRLGRESLEKWINETDFEEIIKGCFVRVLLGEKEGKRVYRIAVIKGVESSDAVYKVGDSLTTKLLILNWGTAHKSFKMDFVSNGNFTPDEYKEWLEQMQKCNLPLVTTRDVENKINHIKSFVARKRQQAQGVDVEKDAEEAPPAPTPQTATQEVPVEIPSTAQKDNGAAVPSAKRQKIQATPVDVDDEPMAVADTAPEQPPGVDYETALAAAKKYYVAVKSHFDEQSEYLLELEAAQSRYIDFLRRTQVQVDLLARDLEQKRRDAGESLDDTTVLEREHERELAETQRKYEEELEVMRKEVRKREKMQQDRENDIADIQRQLQKAKTLAETERASLRDHLARKEKQLQDIQKQHNDAHEKLHAAHLASQDQQQVINLQDHTMQELETQLRAEHAQAIVTQQKRRKQALVMKQRLAEYQRLKDEELELQEMIKQLIDPTYVPKVPLRSLKEEASSSPAPGGAAEAPEGMEREVQEPSPDRPAESSPLPDVVEEGSPSPKPMEEEGSPLGRAVPPEAADDEMNEGSPLREEREPERQDDAEAKPSEDAAEEEASAKAHALPPDAMDEDSVAASPLSAAHGGDFMAEDNAQLEPTPSPHAEDLHGLQQDTGADHPPPPELSLPPPDDEVSPQPPVDATSPGLGVDALSPEPDTETVTPKATDEGDDGRASE